jgi:hypothetical protein
MNGRTYRHRRRGERAVWPDTTLARAYLIALLKWAGTHHEDVDAKVTLPVGAVGVEELLNVLRALERARQQANYHHPSQLKPRGGDHAA